jgi:hypothetical protein
VILERFQPLLGQGSVLVDDADEGADPRLLIYLEHAIRDGRTAKSGEVRAISQRLQFIQLKEDGSAADAGPAPYLDYRPIKPEEKSAVALFASAPWLAGQVEQRAMGYAIANLVPRHLAEVRERRLAEIDKVEREVRERLNREINYWDARRGYARRSAPARSSGSTPRMPRRPPSGSRSGSRSAWRSSRASGRSRRCRRS